MTIKNKLNRLKSHLVKEEKPVQSVRSEISLMDKGDIPYIEEWQNHHAEPFYFDHSYCFVREVKYPLSHQHGKYRFEEFLYAVEAWNSSGISHPLSAAGFEPADLFFFDTETTGLGGGTGNTIFLLGHASIQEGNFMLKQHILPHPGAEVPLYQSFLENINYRTLVTYNGKSFDWPQVKTRHTLIREHVPRLPHFGHFDLYHAARRLWKHRLDKVKLAAVEKDVLEFERKDDIPGFLAPMIYFDFVERKNPEGMFGILKHNEQDILSLITLYTHLSFQLLGIDKKQSNKETYEVGRWFSTLGEREAASKLFSELTKSPEAEQAAEAKLALGFEQKKLKNWERALELFLDVCDSGIDHCQKEALIEAAKIFEHRGKDFVKALECSNKAELIHDQQLKELNIKSDKLSLELNKRIVRLMKKIKSIKAIGNR